MRQSFLIVALCWNLSLLAGCDRTPPEPEGSRSFAGLPESAAPPETAAPTESAAPTQATARPTGQATQGESCIVPLADPAPPPAKTLEDCPKDPDGPPEMPRGRLTFADASNAPALEVELARTLEHQMHGLMFRADLDDQHGMLFSYAGEGARRFWMKNTCLALDMLFIDAQGFIVGILRQVPPWNTRTRTVSCPAMHVLEVRAGFTETYGIEPGQKVLIEVP